MHTRKETCKKYASDTCTQNTSLLLNEAVEESFIHECNPYKLVPIMNVIVANPITVFKSTAINSYSRPLITSKQPWKGVALVMSDEDG